MISPSAETSLANQLDICSEEDCGSSATCSDEGRRELGKAKERPLRSEEQARLIFMSVGSGSELICCSSKKGISGGQEAR